MTRRRDAIDWSLVVLAGMALAVMIGGMVWTSLATGPRRNDRECERWFSERCINISRQDCVELSEERGVVPDWCETWVVGL